MSQVRVPGIPIVDFFEFAVTREELAKIGLNEAQTRGMHLLVEQFFLEGRKHFQVGNFLDPAAQVNDLMHHSAHRKELVRSKFQPDTPACA